MGSGPENLEVLNDAQHIADEMWSRVSSWEGLARDVVGAQVARAADSIGANIAEAFGRYHYADKIRFLYYARGSLFETKFWVRRAEARGLIGSEQAVEIDSRLTRIARQLNALVRDLRSRGRSAAPPSRTIHEGAHPEAQEETLAGEEDNDLEAFPEDWKRPTASELHR